MMIDLNLVQGTDYLFLRLNFGKTFKTRIPTRGEKAAVSVLWDYAILIFMDESKTEAVTGSRVCSNTFLWHSVAKSISGSRVRKSNLEF